MNWILKLYTYIYNIYYIHSIYLYHNVYLTYPNLSMTVKNKKNKKILISVIYIWVVSFDYNSLYSDIFIFTIIKYVDYSVWLVDEFLVV